MHGQRHAVIVGVNRCPLDPLIPDLRYAEADAQELKRVLTDHRTGSFAPADVTLLVGEQATSEAVIAALRGAALNAGPRDVLLVFFAGHGVLSDWDQEGDPYLATADFNSEDLWLHPGRGLRMRSLRQDVFEQSRGSSFLILDCCHAGGYSSPRRSGPRGQPDRPGSGSGTGTGTGTGTDQSNALLEALASYELPLSKHTALMACPHDAAARESDELRHGVLTHHLLVALGGAATGNDGCVTFAEAVNFVKQQDLHPPVGLFARDWGPTTVLTRPAPKRATPGQPAAPSTPAVKVVPCSNPLDASVSAVRQLLDRAFRSDDRPSRPGDHRIELVRHAVAAEAAAVVELTAARATVPHATAGLRTGELAGLFDQLARSGTSNRKAALGQLIIEEEGRQLLAVPLTRDSQDGMSCLVLVNPARPFLDLGEALAAMLHALWQADLTNPRQAEVDLLTALRTDFGRVPLELYDYCFDVYRDVLRSLVMVFQPVMELAPTWRNIGIHGYEALARQEREATAAPVGTLQTAHAWGDQFVIERDSVLAEKAIRSYARAHDEGPWRDRPPLPLSINVAVRCLLSNAYVAAVDRAIQEAGMVPRTITLEISEQDRIEPAPGEQWLPDKHTYFHKRLSELTNRLRVGFAVDDFGVGYASLNRLSTLTLTQIKVDRAILQHPPGLALKELALVMDFANHAMREGSASAPRPVVVEGVDDTSRLSLKEIYETGIHLVQGYILEQVASTRLTSLDDQFRERIAAQVRGTP